jgi:hemerythrin-like domain-containing protein
MGEALGSLHKGLDAAPSQFEVASAGYIELLRHHIDKENNVLFPMADRSLSEERQVRISEEFDRLEKERIGEGRHEAFHQLMDDLARIYAG